MKTRKIKDAERALFVAMRALRSQGFWSDTIRIEEVMISAHFCPHCHNSLVYEGWSDPTTHHAFGVCDSCQFAKLFWTEKAEVSWFVKKVCKAVQKTV